ncbi:MAG TPA: hypothetical protein VFH47_08450 [Candidatus Thermoplasmatota archaeon]|nr:hypothetical protein [Candidatus Thermoplasmatota archaeon]
MRTLAAIAALLLAVSAAAAQSPLGGIETRTQSEQPKIPAEGPTTLPVIVTLDCAVVLTNPTATAITLTPTGHEAHGLQAEPVTVPVSAAECLPDDPAGAGQVEKTAELVVTPTQATPGERALTFQIESSYGSGASAVTGTEDVDIMVEYRPCFRLDIPDGHTFQVDSDPFHFELVQEYCGNALSMIMFEELRVQGGGTLSGLELLIEQPPKTVRQNVTFRPPTGEWQESTATFLVYVHHIDPSTGTGGPAMLEARPTWRFVNAGIPAPPGPEDNDSPGAGVLLLLVALAAAAFLVRRRA